MRKITYFILLEGLGTFLLGRAIVGVGEASFATISPSLLSDFYPPQQRNRVMTIFYIATPVGSALGFILGGITSFQRKWRTDFGAE